MLSTLQQQTAHVCACMTALEIALQIIDCVSWRPSIWITPTPCCCCCAASEKKQHDTNSVLRLSIQHAIRVASSVAGWRQQNAMNFHDIVSQFSSIQTCTCMQVRRVAAQGGELIESDTAQHTLAPDTVWVTAENPDLTPPDVEDSRTFGPLALDSVVGRCIYAIRSKTDRDHLVNNKARSRRPRRGAGCV